jgi:hypothetical protein
VVDVLLFKDILCGTRARPCPKYLGNEDKMGLQTAPDIFLFPQRIPSLEDPEPPIHTLETLRLPNLILDYFGVDDVVKDRHIWEVRVGVVELPGNRLRRVVRVRHQGQLVEESLSRPWSREE